MSKNITSVIVFTFFIVGAIQSQIKTPAPSPMAKFSQAFGLIEVSGEYSRPGVKGRAIFGDLVPFDKVWRTGANAVSKLSFSGAVTVQGKDLAAGDYAILTKPGMKTWDIHFYNYDSGSWSSYVDKDPALIVTADVVDLPISMENFSILMDNVSGNTATLEFIWDKTLVSVELGTEVDKAVMANIEKVLAGPTVGDYYTAGTYMYNSGKDLNTALSYIQKATHTGEPRYWQLRMESEVLGKLGRYDEAIKVATKSKDLATKAGNDDYIKINDKNIAMWSSK